MDSDDEIAFLSFMFLLSERKRKKRSICAKRIFRRSQLSQTDLVNEMKLYDEESHVSFFRMTRSTFDVLLSKVGPLITHPETHSDPISPKQRLAVTLRILATGDSQQTVGICFRMGKATVHQIVKETCDALIEVLRDCVPKPSESSWKEISMEFESRLNFPHCIGAVDGQHVKIKRPSNVQSEYLNCKTNFSIILLAAVDYNYCFTIVDIGSTGRQSDSGVFSASAFSRSLENGELNIPSPDEIQNIGKMPYFFVGDEAFPLKENLQTPFPKADLVLERKIYNYRLGRVRRVSENAFGILAVRWRIYYQPLLVQEELAKKFVYTTVLLHNFLKGRDSDTAPSYRYMSDSMLDFENSEGEITGGQWRQEVGNVGGIGSIRQIAGRNNSPRAADVRERFCYYFNNTGVIPLQTTAVTRGYLNV